MKVKDILIKAPVNIERTSNLSLILKIFKETGFEALPVVDSDMRLVGIIDFDDIAKIFEPYAGPLATLVKTLPFLDDLVEKDFSLSHISPEMGNLCIAEDIMNTNFVTLDEDMELQKAYSIMRLYKVDLICVVREGHLVGTIRLLDIIISLFQEKGVI